MKLCDVLRPMMRISPRQSMAILGYLGAGYAHDPEWKTVSPRYRSSFDRDLQCIITADLAEWGGRSCYYWGRFFDVTHQAVLRRFLSPGDTYIDIGANVGYQSLYASRLVGPQGQVLSFEPNPSTYPILAAHVAINRISNCRTFQMALGDSPGDAVLSQLEETSGTSTLRAQTRALRSAVVSVARGDDVLRGLDFTGKVFVKIDVEGFEQRVLSGLRATLERAQAVAVEVTPQWLAEQGSSAEELYTFMRVAGFWPLLPKLVRLLGLWTRKLELSPLDRVPRSQHDIVFVKEAEFEQVVSRIPSCSSAQVSTVDYDTAAQNNRVSCARMQTAVSAAADFASFKDHIPSGRYDPDPEADRGAIQDFRNAKSESEEHSVFMATITAAATAVSDVVRKPLSWLKDLLGDLLYFDQWGEFRKSEADGTTRPSTTASETATRTIRSASTSAGH